MFLSREDFTRLDSKVGSVIKKDAPISSDIVVIYEHDALFYKQAVKQFTIILQKIGRLYYSKISSKEYDSQIVALLEKNVPKEMIAYIRKDPPFLNFSRLDFQGRYVIEYNSSPGFVILTSTVEKSLEELGLLGKYKLKSSTKNSAAADKLLWNDVFSPLVKKAKHKSIAILDRIGDGYSTNIYGDLENLSKFISENSGTKAVFPCSDKDFDYKEGQLVHKKSGTAIGVVHIAASEGENFERWIKLAGGPIMQAYKEGNVELWPNLANSIFTSKFMLAYLSDAHFDSIFQITPEERAFLNDIIPWARILNHSIAQTAKWMVKNGLTVVIKPGHGSGGRGVYILDKDKQYSYLLNKCTKEGNYICMSYAPADKIRGEFSHTLDATIFLETPKAQANPDKIILTSRVFKGGKVNTVSEGAGVSPVMIAD